MRKTFFLTLFTLLAGLTLFAQNQKLEGNGNIVTRDVSVTPFNTLKAKGVYELHLLQGGEEGVKIEADENLQDLFTVKNEGNGLVVEMKTPKNTSLNTKKSLKVYVTFKSLKQIDINTVGEVRSKSTLSFEDVAINNHNVGDVELALTAKKISLQNKSVGEMTLSGTAQDAVIVNNGVGNLDAGKLVVQTMDIDNSGVGSVDVNAQKGLRVKESFLGKVKNKGAATARKKNIVVI